MQELEDLVEEAKEGVVLRVHVQPAAGRSQIVGRHGPALKVRVAAPPEGGRANGAVCELLAETFGLAKSAVRVSSGERSRAKRILLAGAEQADVLLRVRQLLSPLPRGRPQL